MKVICGKCKSEQDSASRFCSVCGRDLLTENSGVNDGTMMNCLNCGKVVH